MINNFTDLILVISIIIMLMFSGFLLGVLINGYWLKDVSKRKNNTFLIHGKRFEISEIETPRDDD